MSKEIDDIINNFDPTSNNNDIKNIIDSFDPSIKKDELHQWDDILKKSLGTKMNPGIFNKKTKQYTEPNIAYHQNDAGVEIPVSEVNPQELDVNVKQRDMVNPLNLRPQFNPLTAIVGNDEKKDSFVSTALHGLGISQRVVFNPTYNYLLENGGAQTLGFSGAGDERWKALPTDKKVEAIKDYDLKKNESMNKGIQSGIEDYVKGSPEDLKTRVLQYLAKENTTNASPKDMTAVQNAAANLQMAGPAAPKPADITAQKLYDENSPHVNELRQKAIKDVMGEPITYDKQYYDPRVGTFAGKVNTVDILNNVLAQTGNLENWYKQPKVAREMAQTAIGAAGDFGADPLVVIGAVGDALRGIGLLAKGSKAERAFSEYKNAFKAVNSESLTAAKQGFGEMKTAMDASKNPIVNAVSDVAGVAGDVVKNVKERLVYDEILKNGVKRVQELYPEINDTQAAEIVQKVKNIRSGMGAVSSDAVGDAKSLVKGTGRLEAEWRMPVTERARALDEFENLYIDPATGAPARSVDTSKVVNPAAEKYFQDMGAKTSSAVKQMRNNIDADTLRTISPRKLANGDMIGGPLREEDVLPGYVRRLENEKMGGSSFSSKLVRAGGQGTTKGIENLAGAGEKLKQLRESGKNPLSEDAADLFLGFTHKTDIPGTDKTVEGFKDARFLPWDYGNKYAHTVAKLDKLSDIASNPEYVEAAHRGILDQLIKPRQMADTYTKMINDPIAFEKMKNTPMSFQDIFQKIADTGVESGTPIKGVPLYKKNLPLQYAASRERMAVQNNLLDSLVEMNKDYGDGVVKFVRKGTPIEEAKIPKGYSIFSQEPFDRGLPGRKAMMLSTTHDVYMPNELIDAINGYQRAWQNNPGLNIIQKLVGTKRMKVAQTTGKLMDALGFVSQNSTSGLLADAAMTRNPFKFGEAFGKATSSIAAMTGGAEDVTRIKTSVGEMSGKQFYDTLKRLGALDNQNVRQAKYIPALENDLSKGVNPLINITRMTVPDVGKMVGRTVARNLNPFSMGESTATRFMGNMNNLAENANRMTLGILLSEQGMPIQEVANMIKKLHADYSQMTPLVKEIGAGLLIPFISFNKAMVKNLAFGPFSKQLGKAQFVGEGQDRTKRSWSGQDPNVVQQMIGRKPLTTFVSPRDSFDIGRNFMTGNLAQTDVEDRGGTSSPTSWVSAPLKSMVGAFPTIFGGKAIDVDKAKQMANYDREFMGGIIRKEDNLFGNKYFNSVQVSRVLENWIPGINILNRVSRYVGSPVNVPELLRTGAEGAKGVPNETLYPERKPWYQSLLPKLQNINSGYPLLVNEDNQASVDYNDRKKSDIIAKLGYFGKYEKKQGEDGDFTLFDKEELPLAIKDKPGVQKKLLGDINKAATENLNSAVKMLIISHTVVGMMEREIKDEIDVEKKKKLEQRLKLAESKEKSWNERAMSLHNTIIPAIDDIQKNMEKWNAATTNP